MQRNPDELLERDLDLLVIGGGIVGACTVWDAACRGLDVALIEQDDFCSGASWNSLKIVHGGLRYLQSIDLKRARRSVRERRHWFRAAPHLLEPLPILVPDRGDLLNNRFLLRAAIGVSDTIAADRNRGIVPEQHLPGGQILDQQRVAEMVPELSGARIHGGTLFWDGVLYSAERLVLSILVTAFEAGAVLLNYSRCLGIRAASSPTVEVEDVPSGRRSSVRARAILDTTGTGLFRNAASAEAAPARAGAMNLVFPGRGHSAAFTAQAQPSGAKGARRRLFFVPWRDTLMVGTHYFYLSGPGTTPDLERETDRFLADARAAGVPLDDEPLLLRHFGSLPLSRSPRAPADLLTSPIILDHGEEGLPGFFTAETVKLTTARHVAQVVLDRVTQFLGICAAPSTEGKAVTGGQFESLAALLDQVRREHPNVPHDIRQHLVRCYGTRYGDVFGYSGRHPNALERVQPGRPVIFAQFLHAAEREMALTPQDLVMRRTELGAVGAASPRAFRLAETALEFARTGVAPVQPGCEPS